MYYGEEIGMSDLEIPYKDALDPIGQKYKKVPRWLSNLADETLNRDDVRTPMQWENAPNAGFSTNSKTWLPVNSNYPQINARTEVQNDSSLLLTIQHLLLLRKRSKTLHEGSLEILPKQPNGVLAYKRKLNGAEVIVLTNFSKKEKDLKTQEELEPLYQIYKRDKYQGNTVHLSGYGAMILGK